MRIPSLLWTFCSAIVIASLVSGCSGNTSTGSNRGKEPARINGYVGASDAYSVLIYAVPIDAQGQPTTELVDSTEQYVGPRSTSTNRAFYQVNVASEQLNRPITFIGLSNSRNDSSQRCQRPAGCTFGGDIIDYRADRVLDADDFEWRASVGTVLRDMRVNINWMTHAASAFAYTSYIDTTDNPAAPRAGIYTPFTIERANLWLSRLFDISDVISLRPLSPAELNTTPDLSSSLRSQGLYYGALLAAAQELASQQSMTPEKWLAELVKRLLNTQGQLVMNDDDSVYSLISIFDAAHTLLAANRDYLVERNATIPPEVETVLARLEARVTGYRDGTIPLVEVTDAEVNASLAPLANAKVFMKDLNDRLFNLTGNHPRTCGKEGVDSDDCVPSFVDYQYVQTVDAYYQAVEDDYRPLLPLLNQGLHDTRDLVEGFLTCVHYAAQSINSTTCPLPTGWSFSPTSKSATNANGPLTLTYKGIALEEAKEGEAPTFNAFDVFLNGKLVTQNALNETATLYFKPLADEDDETAAPTLARVRVVFDEATERPPLVCREVIPASVPSGCIEPLGFDVAWPQFVLDGFYLGEAVTEPESSLRFSFNATLIGVRDVVIDSSGAEPVVSAFTPYHYNLSAVSLTALLEGEQTGQIREDAKDKTVRNQSELLFSGRASNAANYYGQQRWPSVDDFFRVRDGFDTSDTAPVIAPGLFRYRYFEDVEVLFGRKSDEDIFRIADYLEIEILGVGIERIELFKNEDDKGDLGYRKCSIVEVDDEDKPGQTKRQPNLCSDVTAVTEDNFTLNQLIDDDGKLGLFAYPSRGAYKPLFNGALTPTSTDNVIDGELKATFSLGIDRVKMRMAHELFEFANDSETGSQTKRLPMALIDIDLSRVSRERWEVALLAGYDYDYVIEGFPIGIRAQSLYASYFVDMNVPFREEDEAGEMVTKPAGFEAGSLIVNRGGVTLISDTSESIGITIATLADYLPGDVAPGCAVMGRDKNITNGTCNARGYLTYRNALLAVIREERPNVFVIRYIDGTFEIIAPPQ